MKFLVVDDELVSRKKLERILLGFGQCDVEADGQKVVSLYEKSWENWNPYDFIFLDIGLPGQNGLDILTDIRDLEQQKNVPVYKRAKILIVSSHADREHVATALTADCDGYIVKPFNNFIIHDKIQEILKRYDLLRLKPREPDVL